MIGSLWLVADLRDEMKQKIRELRVRHSTWGEAKWHKTSRSRLEFYKGLVDLFCAYEDEVRFRCIAVDSKRYDSAWHNNDDELGFYKCYYQLLHHWISDSNTYRIFCDAKTNRDPSRLLKLQEVLSNANLSSEISTIQSLPSREVALIQLCDLLLGASAARLNDTVESGSAKDDLLRYFEGRLRRRIAPTRRTEAKFNVFMIDLGGGS